MTALRRDPLTTLLVGAAASFALFLIGIIVLADGRHLGPLYVVYGFEYGDKLSHMVLFGILALLVTLAVAHLYRYQPGRALKRTLLVTLALTVLVTLEELSQTFFSARSFDLYDLGASYIGIACGLALGLVAGRLFQPRLVADR